MTASFSLAQSSTTFVRRRAPAVVLRATAVVLAALAVVSLASAVVGIEDATPALAGTGSVPCTRTTIVTKRMPTGPAQYESGALTLRNGTALRVQGSAGEMYQVRGMRVGDAVAACYGKLKNYADAPPSRATTVLDLTNGNYYGTLLGTWQL